jgi:hypothetical protein
MDKVKWNSRFWIFNWLSSSSWEAPIMTAMLATLPIVKETVTSTNDFYWYYGFFVLFMVPIISLIWKEQRRRMYDPTLALNFQDTFESMREQRKKAARSIIECRSKNDWSQISDYSSLDDVINFLDDLGFYLYAKQIGERVMYHHFYHWVEMYYQSAMPYIILERKKYNSQWEFIPNLHEQLIKIEAVKRNSSSSEIMLSEKEIIDKLTDETLLRPPL